MRAREMLKPGSMQSVSCASVRSYSAPRYRLRSCTDASSRDYLKFVIEHAVIKSVISQRPGVSGAFPAIPRKQDLMTATIARAGRF